MEELKALTLTFLQFMSGGEPSKLLEVCLTDTSKKELLSAGSGKTRWASLPDMVSVMSRLDKINTLVRKGQPLKTWSSRGLGEVKARLEVIPQTSDSFYYH